MIVLGIAIAGLFSTVQDERFLPKPRQTVIGNTSQTVRGCPELQAAFPVEVLILEPLENKPCEILSAKAVRQDLGGAPLGGSHGGTEKFALGGEDPCEEHAGRVGETRIDDGRMVMARNGDWGDWQFNG